MEKLIQRLFHTYCPFFGQHFLKRDLIKRVIMQILGILCNRSLSAKHRRVSKGQAAGRG